MATIREQMKRKRERLDMYYAAEEAILSGAQEYAIGTRSLTRANLSEIRKMIDILEDELKELELRDSGKKPRKAFAVVPRDF